MTSSHAAASDGGRLLIYAPVPLYGAEGDWQIETQACNGLRLWAENFDHVTVIMPHMAGPAPVGWSPASQIGPNKARITIVPVPIAWVIPQFIRHYRNTVQVIRDQIGQADYLSFAIGGLVGDWGAVACLQAHKMGRPFGVWTDRVESQVTKSAAGSGPLKRRIKNHVIHRPMAALEKYVIRRATMGLFHGQQTYDTYAPYCRNPQMVHDIHIGPEGHIDDATFYAKLASAKDGPLRIVYAGRASAMKGPGDWAEVLRLLTAADVPFQADWLGDGPLLDDLRADIKAAGLADRVTLHGFVNDADRVAAAMQAAHVFLFCHNTPESPRCLIEALIAGTPIVGYDSSYAADLIKEAGGGVLVPIGATQQLSQSLIDLAQNRDRLATLIKSARTDGEPFDDVTAFAHRSDLIKRDLSTELR